MKDLQLNWQDLIKPKRVVIDEKSSTDYYGKFICEPLEKGYGITLGNALRRVLLSSIKGPAITSIKVEGVLHEFSTIPGVKEDVTQIILNLKGLELKVHTFEKQTITISAMGECDVTAGDIITTHQVDVLNPDHHIATLSEGSKLEMEMTVELGYGYEAVESRGDIQTSIGLIPLDAIYSPVRKVNYSITNARVGRRTDYERLNLEIWSGVSGPRASAIQSHMLLISFISSERLGTTSLVTSTQTPSSFEISRVRFTGSSFDPVIFL